MRVLVLLPSLVFLALGLGSLAEDDGGCPATGQQPYDYMQALCMSFLFYEAQRSGYLPDDQRIKWRGDAAIYDGSDVGYDLEGGYFDAGDHVKFGFPLAFATTTLSWGLIAYPNGYDRAGQTHYARTAIRRATDYIIKCHNNPYELYGQVGDGYIDHSSWLRPEEMTRRRPSYKINTEAPGSDLAGETAAALAAASIVFKDEDPAYAFRVLELAREMFDFADKFRDVYTNSIPEAADFYGSFSGYGDELGWAACWMYKATGEQAYMDKALEYIDEFSLMNNSGFFYWDDKTPGVYALMAELSSDTTYMDKLDEFVQKTINDRNYTPKGLIFMHSWGSLRHAAGIALIVARAASLGLNTDTYNAWARSQIDYILGSTGHSFVVGFGESPPLQPHHRAASCEDPPAPCDNSDMTKNEPNPHVILGALVGGPDLYDNWVDNRSNWVQTEVGLDYNSCYSSLLSAMIEITE